METKVSDTVRLSAKQQADLIRIRVLRGQARMASIQAEELQKELFNQLGIEKVDFDNDINFYDGNGKLIGTVKTSFRKAYTVAESWVTRLNILKR